MLKVTLSFEMDASKVNAFMDKVNGAAKKKAKADADDEDADADDEDADADEDDDADEDADVSLEDIRGMVKQKVSKGLKPKVEALLTKYKAKTTSDLKEAKYAEFFEKLKAIK